MQIGKIDVFWNVTATLLRMGAGLIVLSVALQFLSPDEIGLWTIFLSISTVIYLLDFGFNSTFSRNITYIFSGAKELKKKGFLAIEEGSEIDYSLLKCTIKAMQWFYFRVAILFLLLLVIGGTFYINSILASFQGNHEYVIVSWIVFICILSYQLFTYYYEALMQGRGLIKKSKQILIISQIGYIIIAIIALYYNLGIMALVLAQGISIVISRVLSHKVFYDKNLKSNLKNTNIKDYKIILKNMLPNATKVGLTSLGAFAVSRSSVFIGSLFLPLSLMGSFGITKYFVDAIAGISTVWYATYYPKITQLRINNNIKQLKHVYIISKIIMLVIFIFGASALFFTGEFIMEMMSSKTPILNQQLLIIMCVVSLLETNHGIDGGILLTKNEVPFFKAALVAGVLTLIFLIIFLYLNFGVLSLIIAPGIAQLLYQNWKWPLTVIKELNISFVDLKNEFGLIFSKSKNIICKFSCYL